jgi:predicted enzyme related to lactoylglutathione lyase
MKVRTILFLCCTGLLAIAAGGVAQADQDAVSQPPPAKYPVVYWELASDNADSSVAFFKKVFGWEIQYDPATTIHECMTRGERGGIHGGVFTLQQAKLPFLTVYIRVDSLEAKAEAVRKAGGLVVIEPVEIAPGTWICLFNDPSGVTFAMIEPRPRKE